MRWGGISSVPSLMARGQGQRRGATRHPQPPGAIGQAQQRRLRRHRPVAPCSL